jgi:hypothetical protein
MTPDGEGDYCGRLPVDMLQAVKDKVVVISKDNDYWAIPELIKVLNWCIENKSELSWG